MSGFNMHNRDPEVEALIESLEDRDKAIFRSMRDDFDRITNEGADYDVELHDEQIGKLAEAKFGIPSSQALELYVSVGTKISEFQQERYIKSKKQAP